MLAVKGTPVRAAIELSGVSKSYGRVRALDRLNLAVAEGTILGLLGHNGAGKTTAMRILATLTRPDEGSAIVGGFNVVAQPVAVRRLIGLAGQNAAVDDALTGRENLEIVGTLSRLGRAAARRQAAAVLGDLGLAEVAGRPARTYSGGMRRRLDLAASLIARPPVLLLDEPTAGLDPAARRGLWDLLRALAASGTTILLTTQHLDEADYLAHEVAVLDHGRLIDRGSPASLKRRLGDDKVVVTPAHAADLARAAATIAPVSTVRPVVDSGAGTVTARVASGGGAVASVVRLLDSGAIELADVAVMPPALDDVYLALTGPAATEG
jgi:ABC-2 type transport system ATP-binding protein